MSGDEERFKLVVVGGGGVGKSALTIQFIQCSGVPRSTGTRDQVHRDQVHRDHVFLSERYASSSFPRRSEVKRQRAAAPRALKELRDPESLCSWFHPPGKGP
ncbi:Ras-like protein 3 [Liparis tanakae]|uniref:Ras-like protein 3 n=1 Tax=Liparis tanakae TaxID=230148 RepID=A0A4Z2IXJ5_9TELE|nr:Ras-like protein 3 [Liparis tanakae]